MEDKTREVRHAYGRLQQAVTSSKYAGITPCGSWTGPIVTLARAAKLVGIISPADQSDAQKVKAQAKRMCLITHPDKYVPTNAADAVMAAAVFQSSRACLNVATYFAQGPEANRTAEGRETHSTLRLWEAVPFGRPLTDGSNPSHPDNMTTVLADATSKWCAQVSKQGATGGSSEAARNSDLAGRWSSVSEAAQCVIAATTMGIVPNTEEEYAAMRINRSAQEPNQPAQEPQRGSSRAPPGTSSSSDQRSSQARRPQAPHAGQHQQRSSAAHAAQAAQAAREAQAAWDAGWTRAEAATQAAHAERQSQRSNAAHAARAAREAREAQEAVNARVQRERDRRLEQAARNRAATARAKAAREAAAAELQRRQEAEDEAMRAATEQAAAERAEAARHREQAAEIDRQMAANQAQGRLAAQLAAAQAREVAVERQEAREAAAARAVSEAAATNAAATAAKAAATEAQRHAEETAEAARQQADRASAAEAVAERMAAAGSAVRAAATAPRATRPPPRARFTLNSTEWHRQRALDHDSGGWSGYEMTQWPPVGASSHQWSWGMMPFIMDAFEIPWPMSWQGIRNSLPPEWQIWAAEYRTYFETNNIPYPLRHEDFIFHLVAPVQDQLIAPRNVEGGAGAHLMAYLVGILHEARRNPSDSMRGDSETAAAREAARMAAMEAASAGRTARDAAAAAAAAVIAAESLAATAAAAARNAAEQGAGAAEAEVEAMAAARAAEVAAGEAAQAAVIAEAAANAARDAAQAAAEAAAAMAAARTDEYGVPKARSQEPLDGWLAVDHLSVWECYVGMCQQSKDIPRAFHERWAIAFAEVLNKIEEARLDPDPLVLERAIKWFFILHQLLLRLDGGRRHGRRVEYAMTRRFDLWQ